MSESKSKDPEGRLRGCCSKCGCPAYARKSGSNICRNCPHVAREHVCLEACHVPGCACHECTIVKGVPGECANCGHGVMQHTPTQEMKVKRSTSRNDDAGPSTSGLSKNKRSTPSFMRWLQEGEDSDHYDDFEESLTRAKKAKIIDRQRHFKPKGTKGKGKGALVENLDVAILEIVNGKPHTVNHSGVKICISENAREGDIIEEAKKKLVALKMLDEDGPGHLLVTVLGMWLKYLPGTKTPFNLKDFSRWHNKAPSKLKFYIMSTSDYAELQESKPLKKRDAFWEECKVDIKEEEDSGDSSVEFLDSEVDLEVAFKAHGPSDASTPVNLNNTTVALERTTMEQPDTSQDRELALLLQQLYDNDNEERYNPEERDNPSSGDEDSSRDLTEQPAVRDRMEPGEKQQKLKALIESLNLKHVLKDQSKTYVVRRTTAWKSLKDYLSKKSFDASLQVKVKFIGEEDTLDFGGPKNEMFRLALQGMFETSGLFEPSPHGFLPISTAIAIGNDDFTAAGNAMAMSIVHLGPTPRCLHPVVVSCLCGEARPDVSSYKPVDHAAAEFIEKLESATEATLPELLSSDEGIEMTAIAGWTKSAVRTTLRDVPVLKRALSLQDLVISRKAATEQLKEGLQILGLKDALEAEPQLLSELFCKSSDSVTVDIIVDMLRVHWSQEGTNRKERQKDVYESLVAWLEVVQEGSAGVSLEEFLQFFTAFDAPPPTGWPMQPMLHFKDCVAGCRCLPVANTCSFSLTLPDHMASLSSEDFNQTMKHAIKSGSLFGRA